MNDTTRPEEQQPLSLAERLLLLSFDPATGHRRHGRGPILPLGLAVAVLAELELSGQLHVVADHVVPTGAGEIGGLLGEALAFVALEPIPQHVKAVVVRLACPRFRLQTRLERRLTAARILAVRTHRYLGLVSVRRLELADRAASACVGDAARRGLLGVPADPEILTLVGLAETCGLLVTHHQRPRSPHRASATPVTDAVAAAVRDVRRSQQAEVILPALTAGS